jgi:glucokinase
VISRDDPAVRWCFVTRFVGVDLGATTLSVVVADDTGTVLGRLDSTTPTAADASGLRDALFESIATACERGDVDPRAVRAIGIASVGPIDGSAIRDPVNLPNVDRFEVVGPVAERFDCDARLVNDATAGAIAEAAASGDDHLVYLTLSTGIGAGVVAGGRPLFGHRSNAGEVGHLTLDPTAEVLCGCGATGHWEAFSGGANLVAHARSIAADGVETGIDLESAEPADLLEAVGTNLLATRLADRVATWNAIGVSSVVHAYDPARIVVGGGVALNHPETVVDPIRTRLPDHCLDGAPPVALPQFGADAPVRGALEMVSWKSGDRNR